jgi:hypothetical protein
MAAQIAKRCRAIAGLPGSSEKTAMENSHEKIAMFAAQHRVSDAVGRRRCAVDEYRQAAAPPARRN